MMNSLYVAARLPQKSAFAGVANPIKPVVCRSSTLNLANLSAENSVMINAK